MDHDDYLFLVKRIDRLERCIKTLVGMVERLAFRGVVKPEQHSLSGPWDETIEEGSRRGEN